MSSIVSRFLPDEAATAALAAELAAGFGPGGLMLLAGQLGAGKTALARALIRTLAGDAGLEVPSPSFALVQPYALPPGPLLHADLYRLQNAEEAAELGLFDDPRAMVLVEWPERAPALFDRADLVVTLSIPAGGVGRQATIRRRSPAAG